MYVVADKRIAWHSKENKHYYAGEVIDLSHLSPADLANVIASGVVVEKNEVKHGKTNVDKVDSGRKLSDTAADSK